MSTTQYEYRRVTDLLMEPVRNILGAQPEPINVQADRGIQVGTVGCEALRHPQVIMRDEADTIIAW